MKISFNKLQFFFLILLVGCSSTQKKNFQTSLEGGQCEEAINYIPSSTSSLIFKQTKFISGSAASYILTGLTYGTEFTVYITGGIAGGVVICSPLIAIESVAGSNGSASSQCLGSVTQAIMKSSKNSGYIGKQVYNDTSNWRCPDLTDFSTGLRSVASCYEKKNDLENLEKAKEKLEIVRSKEFQESCINDYERLEISKQYDDIKKKIAEFKQ